MGSDSEKKTESVGRKGGKGDDMKQKKSSSKGSIRGDFMMKN